METSFVIVLLSKSLVLKIKKKYVISRNDINPLLSREYAQSKFQFKKEFSIVLTHQYAAFQTEHIEKSRSYNFY